jgi:hypothetical protein
MLLLSFWLGFLDADGKAGKLEEPVRIDALAEFPDPKKPWPIPLWSPVKPPASWPALDVNLLSGPALLRIGMTSDEVHDLLGFPFAMVYSFGSRWMYDHVTVEFDMDGRVAEFTCLESTESSP